LEKNIQEEVANDLDPVSKNEFCDGTQRGMKGLPHEEMDKVRYFSVHT